MKRLLRCLPQPDPNVIMLQANFRTPRMILSLVARMRLTLIGIEVFLASLLFRLSQKLSRDQTLAGMTTGLWWTRKSSKSNHLLCVKFSSYDWRIALAGSRERWACIMSSNPTHQYSSCVGTVTYEAFRSHWAVVASPHLYLTNMVTLYFM